MTFEAQFFGPGNRLRWEAIQAGSISPSMQSKLEPFLEELRRDKDVLVLPRILDEDRVQWYVLCSQSRLSRGTRDEIRAFIGATYSDYDTHPAPLNPGDPVDAAVLQRYGHNAFKFDVPNRELREAVRERLALLLRLRNERPIRHGLRVRPVGRILRDFEYALRAGDDAVASQCVEELRACDRLGANNLLFLEVLRLAATQKWDTILALPGFDSLLAIARPRRVTQSVIQAVYATHLVEFEQGARATHASECFRSEVYPRFGALYRTRAGISGFEVDASFLLAQSIKEFALIQSEEELLSSYKEDDPRRAYLAALARLTKSPATELATDPLESAGRAFAAAEVDRAYELALTAQPSFERCALLLRCARDMGTLQAATRALQDAEGLSKEERGRLESHFVLRRALEDIVVLSSAPAQPTAMAVPRTWEEWLHRLTRPEAWRSAVAVAEAASREWIPSTVAENPGAVERIAALLVSERSAWGEAALRDALPYIIDFFLAGGPIAAFKPVYENLFLILALDDLISLPQFSGLLAISDAQLALGVDEAGYRLLVRELTSGILRFESPTVANLALEAIDLLVSSPCPHPPTRQEFLLSVAAMFHRWYGRIDAAQRALLRRYARELSLEDAVPPPPIEEVEAQSSPWLGLAGKRVALYSLRESALQRAQDVLLEVSPQARVEAFHDKVGGSASLRSAAINSDVFVIATAAAKHAATVFIEAHRPKGRPTLYARSQGSAGLLDAIRIFLGN